MSYEAFGTDASVLCAFSLDMLVAIVEMTVPRIPAVHTCYRAALASSESGHLLPRLPALPLEQTILHVQYHLLERQTVQSSKMHV